MYKNLICGAIGIEADFLRRIELVRRCGFAGFELDIVATAELVEHHGATWIGEHLANAGVRTETFSLPVDFRGDEQVWQQDLARLGRMMATAQAIGATRCTTCILPGHDHLDHDRNFHLHVERLRPAAQILHEHGIQLGLEYVATPSFRAEKPYGFIHDMNGTLALCQAIAVPNMGLLLDSWHWYCAGESADDIRRLSSDQIVAVHVNDAPTGRTIDQQIDTERRLPAETGVIDIKAFLDALREIGYKGPVGVEPFDDQLQQLPDEEAAERASSALDRVLAL